MTFDPDNTSSLLNCLTRARENARAIRESISAEMWENINGLYWSIRGDDARQRFDESPEEFCRAIMMGSMLFQGLTDQTLAHDQPWLFTQVAKYLDDPYRQRSVTYGLYTADGWDRRLINTLGDWGGDAQSWLAALDKGGVEETVLYPTLGLFMSFIRDRQWQVQICRAYNRMLHEEFIKVSPRLHAVALLPVLDPEESAKELHTAVTQYGCVGAMVAADGGHLLGDRKFDPIWAEAQSLGVMVGLHASGSHLGGAGVEGFPSFIQTHTSPVPAD